MTRVGLEFRHCERHRPFYLRHAQVEVLAGEVRNQLVEPDELALPFKALAGVTQLKVNGIEMAVDIDTDHPVHDEAGNPVLGVCEYDPSLPDTALVSVSPVSELMQPSLALSTLAHELGHACFDLPGWIYDAHQGPDLFADAEKPHRIYRTITQDAEHLSQNSPRDREERFAELRANEFMGSLLVPRLHLRVVAMALAPDHGIQISTGASLHPDFPHSELSFIPPHPDGFDSLAMEGFHQHLADIFGVSARFIAVRMERYGLTKPTPAIH